jgi:hypothetical protein
VSNYSQEKGVVVCQVVPLLFAYQIILLDWVYWQAIDDNAKGRTRTGLFVGVLFGPFRAQIFSLVFVGVGHFLCLFVLVVAPVVALMREVVCLRS